MNRPRRSNSTRRYSAPWITQEPREEARLSMGLLGLQNAQRLGGFRYALSPSINVRASRRLTAAARAGTSLRALHTLAVDTLDLRGH